MRAPGPRSRRGFTLVELMISVVILGMIMSSVALVGISNRRAFDQGAGGANLEVTLRRAVDHVVQELMRAAAISLGPNPLAPAGADDMTYYKIVGVAAGEPVESTLFRLRWEYEEGEIDDGVDNNGNGLVDEGRILYTRDFTEANERTVVICHNVAEYFPGETPNLADDNGNGLQDERGFCLERVGDAIVIRLALTSIVADSGLQTRTIETSVKLRN
jgi:prepilin-type N-terminal cleavage/methylation domain-containing protein